MEEDTLEEKKQDQNLELFLNDEGQLVSGLLQWTTDEDKFVFLKSQLQSNFLVLTKFMRTRREAPQGFLPLILRLCNELQGDQQSKQTLLFIRVCALHQKESLKATKELIQNAFMELSNHTIDEQAAYGLLKLAYLNAIAFKTFPLDSLNKFQSRYQMPLKRFVLFLEGSVNYKPLKCLPLTCFIFTHPFYNILKDSGVRLQENVDPDYQVQFVELLAYSFEGLEENVQEFIDIFTEGCIECSGRNIQLLPLLEKLIIREQKQDKLFFDSLKNQITLFKHLFNQLREKRITKLDDETIDFLLLVDDEQFCKQSRQPRVLGDFDENEKRLKGYWEEFAEMNPKSEFDHFSQVAVPTRLTQLAMLFGIKCLNSAQILSFFITKEKFKSQRLFQQFTTGSGKTTFSLIWMLYAWLEFKIPSIANYSSMELCQNDYERLINEAGSLGLSILLISNEEQLTSWGDYNIVFTTTPLLQSLIQDPQKGQNLKKRQLILDEFDASLFDSEQGAKNAQLFLQFQYLVAFTGSPLQLVHKNILTKHLDGLFLQYPSLDGLRGRNNVCHQVQVFPTRQPQFEKMVDICLDQSSQTPVLVILDKTAYKGFLQISNVRKLLIKNLAQSEPPDVKSFFATGFTTPQNGHFFTALLSVGQGRGLDAPTNSEIEKAGGVYIIIGATPTTFREFEQFKGRTARMGGRGQYSVILWNNKIQGTAETFLEEHLTAQSSKELQNISRGYINISAPKLINTVNSGHDQQKTGCEPKDGMGNENMEDNERENIVEGIKDFDDKIYQNTGKTQKNEEKGSNCGIKSNKDHICKGIVGSKQKESTINKTLGKRKRNRNKTKTYKEPSINKRTHKQTKNINANMQQEKENNNPFAQDNAYVRVNEALKVVIPSAELQKFKKQDCSNCEEGSAQNQQQQKELIKAQQSSFQTKRQQVLANNPKNEPKSQRDLVDEGYFAGYSQSSIHKDMLNDLIRVEQYTKAINGTCNGKVVLDLGCGTGVLSVLAIKAGAIRVYAVDNANIEKLMSSEFKQLVKEGKIEFIKGTIEKLASDEHPKIPKVDIVLSEWMGYFLVFENMMSSYIIAFKTFLKSEGIMIPSHSTMYLDAAFYDFVDNPKLAKKHFNPNNPCKVVLVEQLQANYLLSDEPTCIKRFDFTDKNLQNPLDSEGFAGNFDIQVTKTGTFNAFVGSFDAKLCNEVFLNTMPTYPVTHWKQSLFFIANPIKVEPGDVIQGKIQIKTQDGNHRNLIVTIAYEVEGKESSKTEELFSFE